MEVVYDEAIELLDQAEENMSRELAERAVCLIEFYDFPLQYNFHLSTKVLIYFPDLLRRFLLRRLLTLEDYESMVARCIEYKRSEPVSAADWHHSSLDLLLRFVHFDFDGERIRNAKLRLLAGKHRIDGELYAKAKVAGVRDVYYEVVQGSYTYESLAEIDRMGGYVGYRVAHHLLLYGGHRRRELLNWWTQNGYDCTYDAASDYFETKNKDEIIRRLAL